jgi:hypothetical protein
MRYALTALALLAASSAAAQINPLSLPVPQVSPEMTLPSNNMPRTFPLHDTEGKPMGTWTIFENRIVMRRDNGELIGSIILGRDGSRTLYDPSGKVLQRTEPQKQ